MKKLLSFILPALLGAGSLFGQSVSTVSGVWERGKPKSVKMFKLNENGGLEQIASTPLSVDGSFLMSFTPEREGYFVLGTSGSPMNRYTFYFKPGDKLNLKVMKDSYELVGKENTPENMEMARWHDFIFPMEDKAVYYGGKNSTYVDFFPVLEEKIIALKGYKVKKNKNKHFKVSFDAFRTYDFLQNAITFIHTPRTAHPEGEDFPAFYREMNVPEMTRNTDILKYPGGLSLLVNAYMLSTRLSEVFSEEEKKSFQANPTEFLLENEKMNMVYNDTIKGEIVLQFAHSNRTESTMKAYREKFYKYLITDRQKKRWEGIEANLKESLKPKAMADFRFQDINGTEVALSDFRGKVVYIDFWATWCGPCKKELPYLKVLEEEYKDNKDIVFMGINMEASKFIEKWKDFVTKEQLPGVQLFAGDLANEVLSKPYKITGIPRFMLVNKEGQLILWDAPRPSSSEIRAALNDALAK